jgi:S1-C subfamily serine protease
LYSAGVGIAKDEIEGLAWAYIGAASGPMNASTYEVGVLEQKLGHQLAVVAQQRSKELLLAIKSTQDRANAKDGSKGAASNDSQGDSPKATGTGSIISVGGLVLTAAHVVAGSSSLKVSTSIGLKGAKVLRIDEANDIAILQLDPGSYPALAIAPSKKIRLGQTVSTIGFPNVQIQGFSLKVTRGEISSLNGVGDDPRSWQVSVPVQPGNSGGPLLDDNGNLVGIIVSKLSIKAAEATNDIPQNVNYAVKSTYALALAEQYLDANDPEPTQATPAPRFEDMVDKAQKSVVLIFVY